MICTQLQVDISCTGKDNHDANLRPRRLSNKEGSSREFMDLSDRGKWVLLVDWGHVWMEIRGIR